MNKILILTLMLSSAVFASKRLAKRTDYKTYFGECPSNVAGKLTLELMRTFEEKKSLKSVKEKIVKNKLDDKYFLSEYQISYDPVQDKIKLNLIVLSR